MRVLGELANGGSHGTIVHCQFPKSWQKTQTRAKVYAKPRVWKIGSRGKLSFEATAATELRLLS